MHGVCLEEHHNIDVVLDDCVVQRAEAFLFFEKGRKKLEQIESWSDLFVGITYIVTFPYVGPIV